MYRAATISLSRRPPRRIAAAVLALLASAALCSCGAGASQAGRTPGGGPALLVVAAENFWGSVAGQLAGTRAEVRSLIVNPGTDPHSYQPTAADSRLLAQSRMAIVNGVGYDLWAGQALAANPDGARLVLDTGRLLGLGQGANPHQWYAPAGVLRVIDAIAADLTRLDPAGAAYFAARRQALLTGGLAGYDKLRATIRQRYRGVPVGYSESIFEPLGRDLGLDLVTPAGFARAVAEGGEVTAQDKQTVERQAQTGQIKVWIYNRQNLTPDVQRVTAVATAAHIPTVAITETLSPAGATFQAWQVAELESLLGALHQATGR